MMIQCDTATGEALFAAVCKKGEDWHARLVYADWCEDNGLSARAECLRWMVKARRRPWQHGRKHRLFGWRCAGHMSDHKSHLYGGLGAAVIASARVKKNDFGEHPWFEGAADAELAVYEAWEKGARP